MKTTFSLLTYNIWSGKHWQSTLAFLKEQDADVMCLQEVAVHNAYHAEAKDIDMVTEFTKAFPTYHLVYGPIGKRTENGREESFGNAILSRFPVAHSQVYYLLNTLSWTNDHTKQSRNLVEATVSISGTPVTVMTTHLTYANAFNDTPDQIKEAERIVEIIGDRVPVVLAGDVNSHEHTNVVMRIKNALPTHDALDGKTFAKYPFSYNGFTVADLEYKIDHIFASADVRISNARIIDVPHSDHLLITATITC